jgi:hypothetical protein
MTSEEKFSDWIAALDTRHLSMLTASEVARALRALSSCYVERREKLASGDALGSAGKRAAFALFYAPVHFLVTRAIVRTLGVDEIVRIVDLGCGTGAAGAAWATEAGGAPIAGFDLNPWAVAEASWTYRTFGLPGHARRSDVGRLKLRAERGTGFVAAYTLNELKRGSRASLLPQLLHAGARGARILVVEPIARRSAPWWDDWQAAFERAGGAADEWRFPGNLPARQSHLARAAGLNPHELTARSLYLGEKVAR